MKFFITPEQYNKIYSEESGILINSEISERINYLQDENKKLREVLEYLNTITVLPEKIKPLIREALKEVSEK